MIEFAAALRRCLAPTCLVCALEPGDPVCPGCLRDFFPEDAVRCPVCANRLPQGLLAGPVSPCGRCLARPPRFDATLTLADYAPPVDGLVAALKFRARLDIGRAFGRLLATRLFASLAAGPAVLDAVLGLAAGAGERPAVVALPLGPGRLRERGFNPAEEIARGVAQALRLPLEAGALRRVRETPPQHRLPLAQRRVNVRGAFRAAAGLKCRGVLLVDDVLTSGSTLDEAAGALKSAGAARVVNLVVARTP